MLLQPIDRAARNSRCLSLAYAILCLTHSASGFCDAQPLAPQSSASTLANISYGPQQARAQHGMVASATLPASNAGIETMRNGGNAIDAAVAVALALAVTCPEAGNLGGGGFMVIRLADGRSVAIDYRETAPAAATHDMYLDKAGNLVPGASQVGYRAAGVPGTVAGLALAQKRYGRLKWAQVVQPAIRLAENGFVVTGPLASLMKHSKILPKFDESRQIFQRNGNFYREGEILRQPDLAATLRRLADSGPGEFYTGTTAKRIAASMLAHSGLVTESDLRGYKAIERKSLVGTYRGYQIITMPPPSSGGAVLLEILNQLEKYDVRGMGYGSSATDHLLTEAMRRAFADRAAMMGDPDFVSFPVAGLISKVYAAKRAESIDPAHATPSATLAAGDPTPYESMQTTHFSVVDADGNAVSNTYTLNNSFGCGATAAGTGILLNDEMDDFAAKPGSANGFGLVQSEKNAITPHKRPLSSMAPTIVTKDGKLFLVIGSPGGPTIITTVLQVLVNVIDHGMTLPQAIAAPRIHHQWLPDRLYFERFALSSDVRDALAARGQKVPEPGDFYPGSSTWGDAQGILVEPESDVRIGAADPRSTGSVAGYWGLGKPTS